MWYMYNCTRTITHIFHVLSDLHSWTRYISTTNGEHSIVHAKSHTHDVFEHSPSWSRYMVTTTGAQKIVKLGGITTVLNVMELNMSGYIYEYTKNTEMIYTNYQVFLDVNINVLRETRRRWEYYECRRSQRFRLRIWDTKNYIYIPPRYSQY